MDNLKLGCWYKLRHEFATDAVFICYAHSTREAIGLLGPLRGLEVVSAMKISELRELTGCVDMLGEKDSDLARHSFGIKYNGKQVYIIPDTMKEVK